ncbi:hypothetical protein A2335_02255 [Candidatus Peregrinibacteria bacterium RIFOXYB2_FULL_32_7]|nr:MAG: hypothetical protein A2335_02255 [Candidatus Peregrinibacteria bacterium RIFOXYB2_FULL_32_7]
MGQKKETEGKPLLEFLKEHQDLQKFLLEKFTKLEACTRAQIQACLKELNEKEEALIKIAKEIEQARGKFVSPSGGPLYAKGKALIEIIVKGVREVGKELMEELLTNEEKEVIPSVNDNLAQIIQAARRGNMVTVVIKGKREDLTIPNGLQVRDFTVQRAMIDLDLLAKANTIKEDLDKLVAETETQISQQTTISGLENLKIQKRKLVIQEGSNQIEITKIEEHITLKELTKTETQILTTEDPIALKLGKVAVKRLKESSERKKEEIEKEKSLT